MEGNYKKIIKQMLNEMLRPNEMGDKSDVEMANIVQAKPYVELLAHVANDWGKDSDLYSELQTVFMRDKLDFNELVNILNNYDVYNDYAYLLGLNESK